MLLLKWSESALFSKFQEEAITLMNSRGMEITVGHFIAKSIIALMHHLKPSRSSLQLYFNSNCKGANPVNLKMVFWK